MSVDQWIAIGLVAIGMIVGLGYAAHSFWSWVARRD